MQAATSPPRTALIIGANGMDGSFACDLFIEKGFIVHGTLRRSSVITTERIHGHLLSHFNGTSGERLHYIDMTDAACVFSLIAKIRPHIILNFSAQSHVKCAEFLQNYTLQTNTLGVLNLLNAVRSLGLTETRIYQASTSEQFGNVGADGRWLNETSPQIPVSIYGISKCAAQQICNLYRDAYGMFIVSGLLFNHESERRGHTFVTQKIAMYVAHVYHDRSQPTSQVTHRDSGLESMAIARGKPLALGNLSAKRDWGYAKDYIEAVYAMTVEAPKPKNYVIATGECHSVREFVEHAFRVIGINIEWRGSGLDEQGVCRDTNQVLVVVHPRYYRDCDIECLLGDATLARQELGWQPTVTFSQLVNIMVKAAMDRMK